MYPTRAELYEASNKLAANNLIKSIVSFVRGYATLTSVGEYADLTTPKIRVIPYNVGTTRYLILSLKQCEPRFRRRIMAMIQYIYDELLPYMEDWILIKYQPASDQIIKISELFAKNIHPQLEKYQYKLIPHEGDLVRLLVILDTNTRIDSPQDIGVVKSTCWRLLRAQVGEYIAIRHVVGIDLSMPALAPYGGKPLNKLGAELRMVLEDELKCVVCGLSANHIKMEGTASELYSSASGSSLDSWEQEEIELLKTASEKTTDPNSAVCYACYRRIKAKWN